MLHPSQRLHTALSARMIGRFRAKLREEHGGLASAGLSEDEALIADQELLQFGLSRTPSGAGAGGN